MTYRILLTTALAAAVACSHRGLEPKDQEAQEVCEALCDRWETCGPDYYDSVSDCMEDCSVGPYGKDNPARWDDACRKETLESRGCFSELSCDDWLGEQQGATEKTPAQRECEDLALDESVCRQGL